LDEVLQVVSCLHRHRLLLVGEPGVGKRALVRGLAARIAGGAVPEGLPSRVVRVDMALVVSGSPEKLPPPIARLQAVLDEARTGGLILCVENLPLLFRLWDGTLGELFRSWVAGGAGPLVAPMTPEELKTLEGAQRELLTLFERLEVRPAALADALAVLRAVRERYETHHRVKISDDALSTAVEQAEHLPGLKLPGSALRLLDRSAARVRLKTSAKAPGVQEMDAEFARLEREKDAAVANQDFEKAAALRDQAEKLKARRDQVVREWEAVAGPVSDGVDARVIHEMVAHLGGRGG
jgi:ATP-dependent Clp protease ATP-binding subunit ClpC